MTLTFETVVEAMSDLRYQGHEPAYLLVSTHSQQVMTDGGSAIPNPDEMTVSELEDAISSITDAGVLEAVLEAEKDGDDRKTAKDAIQERLGEVESADSEDDFVVDDPEDTADSDDSNDTDNTESDSSTGGSTGDAVEDEVRMIEPITVLETSDPLPEDVRGVLFGERFTGRILLE